MKILILVIEIMLGLFITSTIYNMGVLIAAKIVNKNVKEYGIGIGPAIINKQIGDTKLRVNSIPINGYVELDSFEEPNKFRILLENSLMYISGNLINILAMIIISLCLSNVSEGLLFMNGFLNQIKNILMSFSDIIFSQYTIKEYLNTLFYECTSNNFILNTIMIANYLFALNIIINILPVPFFTCGKIIKEIVRCIKSRNVLAE